MVLMGGYNPVQDHGRGLASESLIGGVHYMAPVALMGVIGAHIGYLHLY